MTTEIYLGINTLHYRSELCINCGLCSTVCPQRVFKTGAPQACLGQPTRCTECA